MNIALNLLLALLSNADAVSKLIASARASGRDTITLVELEQFVQGDDRARAELVQAIADARVEGR
jgi:hypothetical protein